MDIVFTIIAVLFMLLFLNSIRAIVNKDQDASTLIIFTSLLFGALFWKLLYAFVLIM